MIGRRDGWTDPIGVHPAFRRQGIARALLLTGQRLLKERGMAWARLGTSSANQAMQATAQALGYQVSGHTRFYELALE